LPALIITACGSKKPVKTQRAPIVLDKIEKEDIARRCISFDRTSDKPRYHIMKKGETLYRLSKKYNVTVEQLIKENNIEDYTDIDTGRAVIIPGSNIISFDWPLNGKITSRFGNRRRKFHSGIDISAPKGTHIRAVADGLVLLSGNKENGYSNYGKVVEVYHGEGITSLYAHNRKNLVEAGSCVKKGQKIAEVGATGNATGNHLHLEIRNNGKPVNPLIYLDN